VIRTRGYAAAVTGAEPGGPTQPQRGRGRRQWWPWISLIPVGLGSWAPILGAVRCRMWWWILPGLLWVGVSVAGWVMTNNANGNSAGAGGLLILGWVGGAVTSFMLAARAPSDHPAPPPAQDPAAMAMAEYQERRRRRYTPWPTTTDRSKQWTVKFALIAYALTFLLPNAIGLLLHVLGVHVQLGASGMIVEVFLLGALIPLRRRFGLSPEDLGLRPTHPARSLGLVVLGVVAYGLVAVLWVAIVQPKAPAQSFLGVHRPSTVNEVLDILALSVTAPVAEEVFFRGVLYRSLRNRLPILPAALLAGCLFGFVHITGYPLDTLPVKAAFGVIACLLYERTGSLLPGIALHSFVDATGADVAFSGNDYIVLIVFATITLVILVRAWVQSTRVTRPARVGSAP
jgi:membrane protease YdiL (CAAX protease family)